MATTLPRGLLQETQELPNGPSEASKSLRANPTSGVLFLPSVLSSLSDTRTKRAGGWYTGPC